jgi:phosphoglycolate phosphatase
MDFQKVALVIFDLDGTLVDSKTDIAAVFNKGLEAVGAAPVSMDQIMPLIGSPLKQMYEGALDETGTVRVETSCQAYRDYYIDHCADNTKLFPGVSDCLEALSPTPLAVATTKKTFMAVELVERLGVLDKLTLVQGTDGIPPKPDPALLNLVTEKLGVDPGQCWMVGDTPHDIEAAKRAGMKICAVTYGFTQRDRLEQAAPDLLVDRLMDFAVHIR